MKPLALVSTVTPLIVVVFSALPDEAAPEAAPGLALAVPPEPGDELAHAARISAAATRAVDASHRDEFFSVIAVPLAGWFARRRRDTVDGGSACDDVHADSAAEADNP